MTFKLWHLTGSKMLNLNLYNIASDVGKLPCLYLSWVYLKPPQTSTLNIMVLFQLDKIILGYAWCKETYYNRDVILLSLLSI